MRVEALARRLAFAQRVSRRRVRTIADNPLLALRPIDVSVDKKMDLDAIFAAAGWVGAVKPVRARPKEDYPPQLEEQMKELERQFILRNLGRMVRDEDPDEPLPFTTEVVERPKIGGLLEGAKMQRHEQAELLGEMNIDRVRAELAWRREFQRQLDWSRLFSADSRVDFKGPAWKFDPDDPEIVAKAQARAEAAALAPPEADDEEDDLL